VPNASVLVSRVTPGCSGLALRSYCYRGLRAGACYGPSGRSKSPRWPSAKANGESLWSGTVSSTTLAPAFAIWAAVKGLGEISMWALQRDNGNCVGTKGAESCSGVAQPTWYFSHVFEPFSYLP